MAFNVSEFRSQMQFDGARANLFEVEMNFPFFALPGNAARKLRFVCKTAQIQDQQLVWFQYNTSVAK
jgi:hypothetical protein